MDNVTNTFERHLSRIPAAYSGERIGLFGGSFNPPHSGHFHVAQQALRRLKLDRIWWLVTPGNPLKDKSNLAPLTDRLAACEKLAGSRRMVVSALEISLPSQFTADTLQHICKSRPGVNFIWIMGADNLGQFHNWDRWQDIAALMPIAVVDRPGSTMSLHNAQAANALSRYRIDEADAPVLAGMKPPAWTFLHGPRNALSSTALRERKRDQ